MKKIPIVMAIVFMLPLSAQAETIKASVNGMVCAFCATGIEKSFEKRAEVSDVIVDLEQRLVTIQTKEDQTLADEDVKKVITDAGYEVTGIVREDASETAQ